MRRTLALLLTLTLGGEALAAPKGPAKPPGPQKPPPAKGAKPDAKKLPPSKPGQPDQAARNRIAGGPTQDDLDKGAESAELRALRELELEMFQAPAGAKPGAGGPSDGFPAAIDPDKPTIHASGLVPKVDPRAGVQVELDKRPELAWLKDLKLPDIAIRWDARLVRYLQHFKDDPRGRALLQVAWKRSGRYEALITRTLRKEKVPVALLWLSMTESSFDPTVRSPAGAAGLWQFMPDGGKLYGLRVERLLDERLDPVKSTTAAAKFLSDLEKRFGSWELALAAYNMGYGGLLTAVRKYNTNDYWELSKHEAGLPWETTLYVPKILAFAIAAENPSVFGLEGVQREAPLAFDTVTVPDGVSVTAVARASGADERAIEALNPQLRARRVPLSGGQGAEVRVPEGAGDRTAQHIKDTARTDTHVATHTVRFGETLDSIADLYGLTKRALADLNAMTVVDAPRPGEAMLVPEGALATRRAPLEKAVVVVPASPDAIPGKKRVFYRVIAGDTLRAIAGAFAVSQDDLKTWNALDPSARLQEGMTLQVFVEPARDLSKVVSLAEDEARVLVVGTEAFFQHFEAQKGRHRTTHTVTATDTWKTIAKQYGISVGLLERINRKPRTTPLVPGETIVVYTGKSDVPMPAEKDDDPIGRPAVGDAP